MRSQTRLTLGVAMFAASLLPIATMANAATPAPDDMTMAAADPATAPAAPSDATPAPATPDAATPTGNMNDTPAPAAGDPGVEQVQANPRGSDAPAVASPAPDNANAPVSPSIPADPSYHGGAYVGADSPAPAQAMNKSYPVCRSKQQDECRQPGGH